MELANTTNGRNSSAEGFIQLFLRSANVLHQMQARYLQLPIGADIRMRRDIPFEEPRYVGGAETRPP